MSPERSSTSEKVRLRWFGYLSLLLLGVWAEFAWIARESDPKRLALSEPGANEWNLGADLTGMTVPTSLAAAAADRNDPSFGEYELYLRLLERHGLERGVLVLEVSSIRGELIYHMLPSLNDRSVFDEYTSHLPMLLTDRSKTPVWLHQLDLYSAPDGLHVTREVAQPLLTEEAFFLPSARLNLARPEVGTDP